MDFVVGITNDKKLNQIIQEQINALSSVYMYVYMWELWTHSDMRNRLDCWRYTWKIMGVNIEWIICIRITVFWDLLPVGANISEKPAPTSLGYKTG
jgi:hypothetical protein